jgi:hypothetical protein
MQHIVSSLPYCKRCPQNNLNRKSNFSVENAQVTCNVGHISTRVGKELADHVLRMAFCGDWTELT